METVSLKKVDAKTREYIKKRVIHLYEKKTKYAVIADTLNISYDAVSRIVRSYKQNGCLLKEKTRGRKKGEKRTLSVKQEREVQRLIIDKYPDQMKLGFALWTRAAVKELIQRLYGIHMPMRSISNYLNRWGLTCQRPAKRAISQDDVKRKTFMEKEYPAIAKRAKKENAVIYWGDETGINNQEYYMRGFSPRGITPVLKVTPKQEKINMISAVSNHGLCRFMCYEDSMTQQRFIEFMKRLVKDAKRKVFFIVDNLKVHHGKMVQAWLKERKNSIEVFYIPTYSPDLNPDEYVNHMLKQDVHSGVLPKNKDDLHKKTYSFMRGLQNSKNRVRKIFDHKKLSYIKKCHA